MLQRLVVTSSQIHHQKIRLTVEQGHYLYRVLRLREGDRFIAMDGRGKSWLTKLVQSDLLDVQAEILEEVIGQTELPVAVTLVAALPKGNGFDEVVRQSTELGVAWIAPVISDRTLLNPSPQKVERWQRIAQEAAEQSERQRVPAIMEPITFTSHLQQEIQRQQSDLSVKKYLCVTREDLPHLLDILLSAAPNPQLLTPDNPFPIAPMMIAIGPEGGWTDTEIDQAIATGYQPVSLGGRILRAVTAPLVALSLIAAVFEGVRGEGMRG